MLLSLVSTADVSGDMLPTAEPNQTEAMVAHLRFDQDSQSFQIVADSISRRNKYICKLSGRLTVIFRRLRFGFTIRQCAPYKFAYCIVLYCINVAIAKGHAVRPRVCPSVILVSYAQTVQDIEVLSHYMME